MNFHPAGVDAVYPVGAVPLRDKDSHLPLLLDPEELLLLSVDIRVYVEGRGLLPRLVVVQDGVETRPVSVEEVRV